MNGWSLIFKVNSVFNLGKKKEKIHPKGLLQVIKQASVKHSEPPNVSPPKNSLFPCSTSCCPHQSSVVNKN